MSVEVVTQRPIDLGQLSAELGVPLCDTFADGIHTICTVEPGTTTAQLQAAVDAHVPVEIPSPLSAMQAQVDELTDLILGG